MAKLKSKADKKHIQGLSSNLTALEANLTSQFIEFENQIFDQLNTSLTEGADAAERQIEEALIAATAEDSELSRNISSQFNEFKEQLIDKINNAMTAQSEEH